MNRTKLLFSLLIALGRSEWTATPLQQAIACQSSGDYHTESGDRKVPLLNLGSHRHPISTKNALTQRYFNLCGSNSPPLCGVKYRDE